MNCLQILRTIAQNLLNNLLSMYINGYDIISNNQAQSLGTSQGNAQRNQTNTFKNSVMGNIDEALSVVDSLASAVNPVASLFKKQ